MCYLYRTYDLIEGKEANGEFVISAISIDEMSEEEKQYSFCKVIKETTLAEIGSVNGGLRVPVVILSLEGILNTREMLKRAHKK